MADPQKGHRIRHPWRISKRLIASAIHGGSPKKTRSLSGARLFVLFSSYFRRMSFATQHRPYMGDQKHPASTIYGRLKTPSIDHTWAIKKVTTTAVTFSFFFSWASDCPNNICLLAFMRAYLCAAFIPPHITLPRVSYYLIPFPITLPRFLLSYPVSYYLIPPRCFSIRQVWRIEKHRPTHSLSPPSIDHTWAIKNTQHRPYMGD
jgi:hypothetical protein